MIINEKLCDSEVQELHFAVGGHQDIARLQVAMHDQPLVSVSNRVADGAEQFETLGDVQVAFVAPAINPLAVDELHHEVRETLFGSGGVQEPGDPGMIERRQNLALSPESRQNIRAIHLRPDQLDGHLLVKRAIGALGEIDGSHAAAADLADERVTAQLPALHPRECIGRRFNDGSQQRLVQPIGHPLPSAEQQIHLPADGFVALALLCEKRGSFRGVLCQGRLKDRANSSEVFGCHPFSVPFGGQGVRRKRSRLK